MICVPSSDSAIDLKSLYAENPNRDRVILHADANCFYASLECLYDPSIRDKPVAVCGDPQTRHGIVLIKNDIAKRRGIQTGEVLFKARQKCPDLVVIPATGFKRVVWPLPVGDLLFVGSHTIKKFISWNILTISDLANADTQWLAAAMGKTGMALQGFALGLDVTPVARSDADIAEKSIGNSATTPRNMENDDDVECVMYPPGRSI